MYLRRFLGRMYHDHTALSDSKSRQSRRAPRGARPTLETLEDRSLPNLLVGPLPLDLGLASLASGLPSSAGEPDSAPTASLTSLPATRLVVAPFGQDLSFITNTQPPNAAAPFPTPELGAGSLPNSASNSSQVPPAGLASPFHSQQGPGNGGQDASPPPTFSPAWTPPVSPPRSGAGPDLAAPPGSTPTGGTNLGTSPALAPPPANPPTGRDNPGLTPPVGSGAGLLPPLTPPPASPPLGGGPGSVPPLAPPSAGPLTSTPGLMGLAQASLPPDITSGSRTNISYTQKGNNANPFHYDATPLAITLGDGRRFTLANPTSGGARKTQLNLQLDNNGAFSSGVSGPDFSITGKVTIDGTTFNGTLVTGEARGFGSQISTGNAEFEVRIVITGGALTAPSTGYLKVGGEMALLLHQPGLKITTFPKTFSYSGTQGTSDARKMKERFTDTEPIRPGCGCESSDMPVGNASGSSQDTGGGSVYLHDGESRQQGIGLTIPGRGIDWSFTPTYRSGIQVGGSLGHNWDFTDNRQLRVVNAENLKEIQSSFPMAHVGDVVRLDGADRADIYVHNADSSYTSPNGFFTRLVLNGDGTYSERDQGGTIYTYNVSDKTGLSSLGRESDRNGNTQRYQYNSVGELSQVTDTLGRPITYSYDSLGELTQVTDYTGRSLRFTYDASGELVSSTSPAVTGTPTGNDFPNGQTTRYTYSEGLPDERLNHELLTVTAPNEVASGGPPRLTYTYDTGTSSPNEGRVTSLMEGGTNATNVPAGGTIQYSYQSLVSTPPNDVTTPVFQTTVTDRNGNITQYQFNQLGNILQTTEEANRHVRPGDPASYVTQYQYDMDYHLLQVTLPQGNSIRYTYDTSNPDRFEQGNLLSVTRTPDSTRGGDQASITTTFTYEPIYNQVHTMTEPRGNDPSYVPQNGGSQSAARYTTTYTYDYQEGSNFAALGAPLGLTAAQTQSLLAGAGVPMGLGDINGDGRTNQIAGNLIRLADTTVTLLPGSDEAAVEGTTSQPIVTTYAYNDFGQLTTATDPEGNVTQYQYYSERDPNGDGTIENPAGNPTTGGYLMQTTQDAVSSPGRDSGTNPPPTSIRHLYQYDEVGNMTRSVDGRGIATDYVYNQLNQVVQITRAAAHNVLAPDPAEPLPLTDFQYLQRYFYDFNDNLVLTQVEDRGNTSNVDGNPPAADLPATAPNPDPVGGPAFADTIYKYDILDQQVDMVQEVADGASPEFLHTRTRYDPNGNTVLTIEPEGNATSSSYDERDLLFQSTTGAVSPPLLTLLAPGDPTSYDVRGGLPSTTSYRYDLNRNLVETVDGDDTDLSAGNNDPALGAGDRTRYTFDGFDRQTSVVDSVGNQTVTQYDPDGNVIRSSSFGPTGGPNPTGDGPATLPEPVSSLGVIQSGNLVNSNLLSSTEHSYDEVKRLIQTDQVLFVNTIPTTRAPDVADGATDLGKGNLTPGDNQAISGVSGVTILGRVSDRTEYDRDSRVTFTVQDDGDTARTFYDGAGRAIRKVDPEGNTVETAYDDNSNVIETRETDVSQVPGVANEIFLTTNFYDSLDRLQQAVDNLGHSTSYRYDSRNNLVSMADAQGPVTGAAITRRAFPDGPNTVDTINDFGNVTRYYYDGLNRKVREETVLTALPGTTPSTASGDGAHVGASIYGIKDDPSAPESFTPTPDPSQGGGDGLIRTGYTWDRNSLPSATIDDQGNVTVSLYDNLDRPVTQTGGLTVHSTLTSANLLGSRQVVTPTAATINNPAAIPTAQIDAQLAEAQSRLTPIAPLFPSLADRVDDHPPTTTIAGYDPDGNVLIRSDENNSYTYTKYDAIDRIIAVRVFRAGQSDSFAGDPIFAPAPASLPTNHSFDDEATFPPVVGTTIQNFQYDGLSRVTQATDNNDPSTPADDSTVTDAYDSLGRIIEETQQIGAIPAKAVDSAWRAENLRKSLTYPNGRVEVYTYDHLDRLKSVADQGAPLAIAVYDYIGVNRVLERDYPINGTRETYLNDTGTTDVGYDGLRRPIQERNLRSDNTLIVGFTYTYDRVNDKLTEGKLHDPNDSESYSYDSAGRLVHFQRAAGGIAPSQSSWTLDGAGNWKQVDGETRQHSSFNEIISRNGTPVLSDDNGNETDDGTFTYTWDALNRLRTVTRKSDGMLVAVYSYDALDRRIRKVVTDSGALNGTTDFYYDGWQVLEEHNAADSPTQQYVYGRSLDEPLVLDRNLGGPVQRLFYHQNALGSVFALTDTTGQTVEGYQYDAYGRQTVFAPGGNGVVDFGGDDVITQGGSSAVGNVYLYTGQRLDAETGLFYDKNRYDATDQGRFISRDPIARVEHSWQDTRYAPLFDGCCSDIKNLAPAQSIALEVVPDPYPFKTWPPGPCLPALSQYEYTGDDPTSRIDPLGLKWAIGQPAAATANTIVCDGKGNIEVQLGGTGNALQTRCLAGCIRQHEESHIADALAFNKDICKGVAKGRVPSFEDQVERKASEIKASDVEINCLKEELKTCPDECKGVINKRITQMEKYRDSFK